MEIKYRPRLIWKNLILFCCVSLLVCLVPPLLSNPEYLKNTSVLVTAFIFVAIPLEVLFGFYLSVAGKYICRVDYFFWKKCLSIKDIKQITYTPTFVVGEHNKTLTITTFAGGREQITMSNSAFTVISIIDLVTYLKQKNPSIQLDDNTTTLLEKNENNGDRHH